MNAAPTSRYWFARTDASLIVKELNVPIFATIARFYIKEDDGHVHVTLLESVDELEWGQAIKGVSLPAFGTDAPRNRSFSMVRCMGKHMVKEAYDMLINIFTERTLPVPTTAVGVKNPYVTQIGQKTGRD
jgi:hypothetical protein